MVETPLSNCFEFNFTNFFYLSSHCCTLSMTRSTNQIHLWKLNSNRMKILTLHATWIQFLKFSSNIGKWIQIYIIQKKVSKLLVPSLTNYTYPPRWTWKSTCCVCLFESMVFMLWNLTIVFVFLMWKLKQQFNMFARNWHSTIQWEIKTS